MMTLSPSQSQSFRNSYPNVDAGHVDRPRDGGERDFGHSQRDRENRPILPGMDVMFPAMMNTKEPFTTKGGPLSYSLPPPNFSSVMMSPSSQHAPATSLESSSSLSMSRLSNNEEKMRLEAQREGFVLLPGSSRSLREGVSLQDRLENSNVSLVVSSENPEDENRRRSTSAAVGSSSTHRIAYMQVVANGYMPPPASSSSMPAPSSSPVAPPSSLSSSSLQYSSMPQSAAPAFSGSSSHPRGPPPLPQSTSLSNQSLMGKSTPDSTLHPSLAGPSFSTLPSSSFVMMGGPTSTSHEMDHSYQSKPQIPQPQPHSAYPLPGQSTYPHYHPHGYVNYPHPHMMMQQPVTPHRTSQGYSEPPQQPKQAPSHPIGMPYPNPHRSNPGSGSGANHSGVTYPPSPGFHAQHQHPMYYQDPSIQHETGRYMPNSFREPTMHSHNNGTFSNQAPPPSGFMLPPPHNTAHPYMHPPSHPHAQSGWHPSKGGDEMRHHHHNNNHNNHLHHHHHHHQHHHHVPPPPPQQMNMLPPSNVANPPPHAKALESTGQPGPSKGNVSGPGSRGELRSGAGPSAGPATLSCRWLNCSKWNHVFKSSLELYSHLMRKHVPGGPQGVGSNQLPGVMQSKDLLERDSSGDEEVLPSAGDDGKTLSGSSGVGHREFRCLWDRCPLYNSNFNRRCNLITHLQRHAGARGLWKCPNCSEKFSHRSSLGRHKRYYCRGPNSAPLASGAAASKDLSKEEADIDKDEPSFGDEEGDAADSEEPCPRGAPVTANVSVASR